jgi:hypothetical protein
MLIERGFIRNSWPDLFPFVEMSSVYGKWNVKTIRIQTEEKKGMGIW